MKYHNILLTFICFCFFISFSKQSFALETFYKSERNPLPIQTQLPNWHQHGLYQPHIIFENDLYKMWYASLGDNGFALAYATSANGLDWVANNLIQFNDSSSNYNPHMVHENGVYTLYMSSDVSGNKAVIRRAVSADGVTFDPSSIETVLQPSQLWESNGLFGPYVVKNSNTYFQFYTGWGNLGFQIGMATSDDGVSWSKCAANPVITDVAADSPFVIRSNDRWYLFYHTTGGIKMMESSDAMSCSMRWGSKSFVLTYGPGTYDQTHMIAPSVLQKDDNLYMYYSGLGPNGWTINLASTVVPAHKAKTPLVFIPGLFASWNKDAIVYNKPVAPDSWVLNPDVREYDGFINTMAKIGYEKNKDYYIFSYDWRKETEQLTTDLRAFIQTHISPSHKSEKIAIVGHSLGGLIGRLYTQRYGQNEILKVVTVGSPHLGAATAYKAVEGGEIETQNTFEWIMQKLVVQLYRDGVQTDKQIIATKLPILKDLFPVYDFLKDSQGRVIPFPSMIQQNTQLNAFNSVLPLTGSISMNSTGTGVQTISGYEVKQRSAYDTLLDLYPDGVPTKTIYSDGDGVVTTESSALFGTGIKAPGSHGEIIYSKASLQKVLQALDMNVPDDKIMEGKRTVVTPSLFFLVMSPAEISVAHNGTTYLEHDGIIFVENATVGSYTLNAKGLDKGYYTVLVGQFTDTDSNWSRVTGEITASPPTSQTDSYTVYFNPSQLLKNPLHSGQPTQRLQSIIDQLVRYNKTRHSHVIEKAISELSRARRSYAKNKRHSADEEFEAAVSWLLQERRSVILQQKSYLMEIIVQIESLYADTVPGYSPAQQKHAVQQLSSLQQQFEIKMNSLVNRKDKHKLMDSNIDLQILHDRLEELATTLRDKQNKTNLGIYILTVKKLLLQLTDH